ncbi:MAG: hypothetical protein ISS02_01860, partial [Candidatus Portnoybacteria bacterium]|nr:hypothetical protein [Candidatus Portnoybacteria bacterium]
MIVLKFVFGILIAIIIISLMMVTASIIQNKKPSSSKTGEDKKFEDWWWNFFKPLFCLPIAWGMLHIIYALLFPRAFFFTFTHLLGILVSVEIAVFMLNTVINKNTKFENRFSRVMLVGVYVIILLIGIGTIPGKLLYGEKFAELDRKLHHKMFVSITEVINEEANQASESHEINIRMNRLEGLKKIANERVLTLNELEEKERIKTEIYKISSLKTKETKEDNNSQKEDVLAGIKSSKIFILPPGEIVGRDRNGKICPVNTGQKIRFIQLNEPGRFWVMGDKIPSYSIGKNDYTTGSALAPGTVEL